LILIQECCAFYQNVTPVNDPAVAPSVNQQATVATTVAKGMNPQPLVRQGIVVISLSAAKFAGCSHGK
jgi:hypothetical protein